MRPIDYAVIKDNLAVVKCLSQQEGFDINLYTDKERYSRYGSDTLLHKAIGWSSTEEVVHFLLQQPGIDVNAKSCDLTKSTPLQLAAYDRCNNIKTIHMLLEAGADLYSKDNRGFSALDRMVRGGVDNSTLQNIKEKAAAVAKKKEMALPIQALEDNPEEEHSNHTLRKMMPILLMGSALALGLTAFYRYKKWRSRTQPDQNKSKKEDQAEVEKSEALWET